MYLAYFGSADPAFYGIQYRHITDGYVFSDQPAVPVDQRGYLALSATSLQGIYWSQASLRVLPYLRQLKPLAILGGSIYVYEWDPLEYNSWIVANRKP
jgi:hypothetical protein